MIVSHRQRYRLLKGLHCTFDVTYLKCAQEPMEMRVEWEPGVPVIQGKVLKKYRAARAAFFGVVEEKIGGPVLIVE